MVCLALELVGSWVELGFSVGMEAFGCFCLLLFHGIRSSQVLELNLLPLASSLSFTVASRLLHPYSTDDKTFRLMVKRSSTARDTERFTELYGDQKRQEGDRRDQEEKRGNQTGREQSS